MKKWRPAEERMVEQVIERRCNTCNTFQPLTMMRKAAGCLRGRASECRACYVLRKRPGRERAKARRAAEPKREPATPQARALASSDWSELAGGAEMTYDEVAAELGISRQAVQQLEASALRKLRRSGVLRELWRLSEF